MNKVNLFFRIVYNFYNQMRLKNKKISLIASNCNGGVILHDLKLPFDSPFINLWLKPDDFLRFCENMDYYLQQKLIFIKADGIDYPVALLGDVKIYFQHYLSEKDAAYYWQKRAEKLNLNHVYILFTDRDGCTYENLLRFDRLKYKHKIVFVHKEYPEIKSSVYIPGFEQQDCVGMCMDFKNRFTYKRYLDSFDYVAWFNEDDL